MKVLVTRAESAARRTAERLASAGHEAVLLPLVEYRDTGAAIPDGPFDAVVFTSAAAAGMLARRMERDRSLGALTRLPAFCVGEATSMAVAEAGFERPRTPSASAGELSDALARRFGVARDPAGHRPARLLYLAGEDRAFDLRSALARHDITVCEAAIYRAQLTDPGGDRLENALRACRGGAALLYSSRTAAHLFALARNHGLEAALGGLTLLAISENVAGTVPGRQERRVLVAERPDEAALTGLLERLGGDDPDREPTGTVFPGTD